MSIMSAKQVISEVKGNTYSYPFAFAYAYNVIVGVGVLAFPRVFSQTGLLLGVILLILICITGYITKTYLIEVLAAANAYHKLVAANDNEPPNELNKDNKLLSFRNLLFEMEETEMPQQKPSIIQPYDNENAATIDNKVDDFEIIKNYEIGAMADMFFPRVGVVLCYLAICLQFVGDASIYAVFAATSLTQTVCDLVNYYGKNESYSIIDKCDIEDNETTPLYISECFGGLSKQHFYYIFLGVFYIIFGSLAYFHLTRTKWLQIITNIFRYLAYGSMIVLAIIRLGQGHTNIPEIADFKALPTLFGITLYSFMYHHYIPGIITPIKNKTRGRVNWMLALASIAALISYLLISVTGSFAFRLCEMNDLYNLDFFDPSDSIVKLIVGTYLALFPFFVLSSRFPITVIALRENVKTLSKELFKPCFGDRELPKTIGRILFTTLALTPPIVISYSTQQNSLLVSITGAFPGVILQFLIPSALVIMSRRTLTKKFGSYDNKYKSPFSHIIVVGIMVGLGVISMILQVINLSLNPPEVEKYPIG